jgi:inner membrane protein
MLLRTHLAFAFLLILFFTIHFEFSLIFILMVILSTIIPDLDSKYSSWGKHLIFRPIQLFTKHRGIFHSFSFEIFLSVLIFIFWNPGFFGFILGYSLHLFLDCFTKDGIKIFWPFDFRISGFIKSGGRIESIFFLCVSVFDVVWLIYWLFF